MDLNPFQAFWFCYYSWGCCKAVKKKKTAKQFCASTALFWRLQHFETIVFNWAKTHHCPIPLTPPWFFSQMKSLKNTSSQHTHTHFWSYKKPELIFRKATLNYKVTSVLKHVRITYFWLLFFSAKIFWTDSNLKNISELWRLDSFSCLLRINLRKKKKKKEGIAIIFCAYKCLASFMLSDSKICNPSYVRGERK